MLVHHHHIALYTGEEREVEEVSLIENSRSIGEINPLSSETTSMYIEPLKLVVLASFVSPSFELFVPTDHWQLVPEGEALPRGLDIRMDLQTGDKWAKLSDDTNAQNQDIVAVPINEKRPLAKVTIGKDTAEEGEAAENEAVENEADDEDQGHIDKMKRSLEVSTGHLELDETLQYVLSGKRAELVQHLETLVDQSHGLKEGISIVERAFDELLKLTRDENVTVRDLSLRVIAQCLRHNKDAVEKVNVVEVLPVLFEDLENSNNFIQKRILGVISALVVEDEANAKIFDNAGYFTKLLAQLPHLQEDAQLRVLNIFEDVTNHRYDEALFKTLEDMLTTKSFNQYALESLFDAACSLKRGNNALKASSEFVNWILEQVDKRQKSDPFRTKLLEARHEVFGNRLALRKAFDEL